MNFNIKRKNLSLSDEISPLLRFINARKSLEYNYKNNIKNSSSKNIFNNKYNKYILTKTKEKGKKYPALKTHSVKLLKDQIFIMSHLSRKSTSNDINCDYNTSLLNTFGNRNFFRKNNEKMNINLFSKYNGGINFFKTTAIKNPRHRNNNIKTLGTSYDKNNLPKLNFIKRKNPKNTMS